MNAGVQDLLSLLSKGQALDDRFKGADLSGAQLPEKASMAGAFFRYTKFENAIARNCDFRNANLRHADFSGADLRGSRFEGADVGKANFSGAKVGGSTLCLAENLGSTAGIRINCYFFAQRTLEDIMAKDSSAELAGDTLTLREGTFEISEAVRVTSLLDGEDTAGLLDRVLTAEEAAGLKNFKNMDEYVMEIGTSVYEISTGYLGFGEQRGSGDPARASDDDMTLLQDFLLGSME